MVVFRLVPMLLTSVLSSQAFISSPRSQFSTLITPGNVVTESSTKRMAENNTQDKKKPRRSKNERTIADFAKEVIKEYASMPKEELSNKHHNRRKKVSVAKKRTRQRTDNPQQTYVYKKQRMEMEQDEDWYANSPGKNEQTQGANDEQVGEDAASPPTRGNASMRNDDLELARQFGLNPTTQVADVIVGDVLPRIMGTMDLGNDKVCYVLYKPVGWSILGDKTLKKKKRKNSNGANTRQVDPMADFYGGEDAELENPKNTKKSSSKQTSTEAPKDDIEDIDMSQLLSVMSPSEIKALERDGGIPALVTTISSKEMNSVVKSVEESSEEEDEKQIQKKVQNQLSKLEKKKKKQAKSAVGTVPMPKMVPRTTNVNANRVEAQNLDTAERPSLVHWLKFNADPNGTPIRGGTYWKALAGATAIDDTGLVLLVPKDSQKSIYTDSVSYTAVIGTGGNAATKSTYPLPQFDEAPRLSIVASRSQPRKSRNRNARDVVPDDDPLTVVEVQTFDDVSNCDGIAGYLQNRLKGEQGIRGDANAAVLDRRASRRLIHCHAISVSSLVQDAVLSIALGADDDDDDVTNNDGRYPKLPDDIAVYTQEHTQNIASQQGGKSSNTRGFTKGSFCGRDQLRLNSQTNAYREIHTVGDGHPGWIIDRYGEYVLIQEQQVSTPASRKPNADNRGGKATRMAPPPPPTNRPIPSIHDGYTKGVYTQHTTSKPNPQNPDQTTRLVEGTPAPNPHFVLENGISYLVTLDDASNQSTGLFLDQRPLRGWLSSQKLENTKLLNCFAHGGGYSVAAAKAGCETTSLDLDKKWLDRIYPQMLENGFVENEEEFKERHDTIYGDCFDWLKRLSKRNEQYDIVILDPPSTSIGSKKKRWSVKNDMAELVALAAPLVKTNGLLFTTNNCSTLPVAKFAKSCWVGLEAAGMVKYSAATSANKKGGAAVATAGATLERVIPMPYDFPTVGEQSVTNLVWRL